MRRYGLVLFLAAATAACATGGTDLGSLPVQEFAGHLVYGEEASWFMPCTGAAPGEQWWVTYTDRSVAQIRTAAAEGNAVPGERVFVRWRAARTDGRVVGPGGPALLVRDILELRPPAAADCPSR